MINVYFKIAWRYFFSRSHQTVINRISNLAVFVILIATCSLFIVLSAFSGLKDFSLSFNNVFDPDFRVLPEKGKQIYVDSISLKRLESLPEIIGVTPVIEEKIFLSFEEKNHVAFLKGVAPNFSSVIPTESIVSIGEWISPKSSSVILGYGIANILGAGVYDYSSFLKITSLRNNSTLGINQDPFSSYAASVIGLYQISEAIDKKYVLSDISYAKKILGYKSNFFSYLEVKSYQKIDAHILQKKIQEVLGYSIKLKSRSDLNEAIQKMMNTENLVVYLIFTLILIIAFFNLSGALLIIILDKKNQLKILAAIGLDTFAYKKIFFLVGCLITFFGGTSGIILGSLLVLLQKHSPFIKVPGTDLPYPILLELENLGLVLLTLFLFGGIVSAITVKNIRFLD